uniref:SET domain containing protein-like protein n=1 Tax=Adineta vaga TaxID=104782 RepID=B3G4Q0_ADIVA|nr:SET domain containing protein-like protein [Adineta vaga]
MTALEACAIFNHSFTPNLGFSDDLLTAHVALRDIEEGEELTTHYGCFEDEHSFYNGINYKCSFSNCSKILYFDFYKNLEFQDQYYKYCSEYIQSKIRKLRPDIES